MNPIGRKSKEDKTMTDINPEAIAAAEDFARKVLALSPLGQDMYWQTLRHMGFTEGEITMLQKYTRLYKLFTEPRYYRQVQDTVAAMLLQTYKIG
jgi:hypothetical protein